MNIKEIIELPYEEIRLKYRAYMLGQGLSGNTINTAYSESFYIWKKASAEVFWQTVLSASFEEDAKHVIMELLEKHSKVDPYKNVNGYLSHLRRFREFVKCWVEDEVLDMPITKNVSPKIKKSRTEDYEETIIIERMYAGGYLDDNIGHEIINTFRTDLGENYIYISPWGIINSKYQNTKAVLLVRLINEHCYEVIGYASQLKLLLSQEAMQNRKQAREIEDKRQHAIIEENEITYGGLPINELFSEQENTVYVTFKAENYRSVKNQSKIYIVDDESHVLNENYIFIPEFRFSNQSLKLYAPKNTRQKAFEAIDALINTEQYWENNNTSSKISHSKATDSTFGLLDVIGKSDDELVYSNWIGYYLKNYPRMMQRFAEDVLGLSLSDGLTEIKREYHNIDLWLEDDENIVVIENKIKSGINGVDADRHDLKSDMIQSQLSKYYSFAEDEAEKKNKKTNYFIFLPDYSYKDEDLSVYLMAEKYTVIRYSEISSFFDSVDDTCLYVDEFKKAIKKHATPYYKDLYQIMEERFVNKINRIKSQH